MVIQHGIIQPHRCKFFEFKTFSVEKIETASESIKAMANELANKIKVNLNDDGSYKLSNNDENK